MKNHNALLALLRNNMDHIAIKYSDFFIPEANSMVFIFAIKNENSIFLKHALVDSIFSIAVLTDEEIIKELLRNLEKGSRMGLCLNIMTYTDFGRWHQPDIKYFLEIVSNILGESDDKNNILMTSNTQMALAHCCEFLRKIGKTIKLYKKQSEFYIASIETLAEKVMDNTADELVERIFMDLDFKNRTLFNIVSTYSLRSFMMSDKVNGLLDSIWEGVHTSECDGSLDDFSMLTYLAASNVIGIPGRKLSVKEMLTNHFVAQVNGSKFWFQYKFRHISVSYGYIKDLI
jgi:hypothetical protein